MTPTSTPVASQQTQLRRSLFQVQAASTMLKQPIVIPARRCPCSVNLSMVEPNQG